MATNLELRAHAMALDNLRAILRSTAVTTDFFKGYSLGEAILDRMSRIGALETAEKVYKEGTNLSEKRLVDERGYVTMQSQLLLLKEMALGVNGVGGMLEAVEELDMTAGEPITTGEYEPDPDDPNLLISTVA